MDKLVQSIDGNVLDLYVTETHLVLNVMLFIFCQNWSATSNSVHRSRFQILSR